MSAEPFYILAIDGGGIRGVFPAHILKCIQSRLKVSLLRKFGMISGTSTGSIVAAAVALGRLDEEAGRFDLVVAADFGHGLIDPDAMDILQDKARLLAVN